MSKPNFAVGDHVTRVYDLGPNPVVGVVELVAQTKDTYGCLGWAYRVVWPNGVRSVHQEEMLEEVLQANWNAAAHVHTPLVVVVVDVTPDDDDTPVDTTLTSDDVDFLLEAGVVPSL